jgi:hypothetical protein
MIDFEMNWDTSGDQYLLVAQTVENSYTMWDMWTTVYNGATSDGMFAFEGEDLSIGAGPTNGSSSTPTDAGRHAGEYERFTASGGVGSITWRQSYTPGIVKEGTAFAFRVFALARSSSTTSTVKLSTPLFPSVTYGDTKSVQTVDTWELVDLGTIDARDIYDDDITIAGGSIYFDYAIAAVPDGETFDIDVVFYLPVNNGFTMVHTNSSGQSPQATIRGTKEKLTSNNPASGSPAALGLQPFFTGFPGNVLLRRTLLNQLTDGTHDLTDTATINITVTPRTRHLLGT